MTDFLRTADDVRSFCQSADQVLSDAVRDAATAYHDACQEVNARLRRCEDFLQKGLRSEAIQLAEAEPPLLEALAALDFPERPQWDQLTGLYGLSPAPKLRTETAEALNRAYPEEQPLQQLLRTHRRMNLARAPVRDRLALLRELHKYDGKNPIWADDIRSFEAARHRELIDEAETAIISDNFVAVNHCWEEVQDAPWFTQPPAPLVNRLRSVFLRQLAGELDDAVRGEHFERAQKLRVKWDRLSPRSVLSPDDPIWDQAKPALDWIAREQHRRDQQLAFENAVTNLESGLRARYTVDDLRELWNTASTFGRALPPGLSVQYLQHVERQQKDRDYRERLILVSAFSVGAVALLALLFFMFFRSR